VSVERIRAKNDSCFVEHSWLAGNHEECVIRRVWTMNAALYTDPDLYGHAIAVGVFLSQLLLQVRARAVQWRLHWRDCQVLILV